MMRSIIIIIIIVMIPWYAAVLGNNSRLDTKLARRQWETAFNDAYIRTVTETVDQNIHTAFQSIMNDSDQGIIIPISIRTILDYSITFYWDLFIHLEHDQLFYLVYERVQVSKGNLIPHMWTFQSKVTLESLTQKIQEKSIKDQHPILHHFLQAVRRWL